MSSVRFEGGFCVLLGGPLVIHNQGTRAEPSSSILVLDIELCPLGKYVKL